MPEVRGAGDEEDVLVQAKLRDQDIFNTCLDALWEEFSSGLARPLPKSGRRFQRVGRDVNRDLAGFAFHATASIECGEGLTQCSRTGRGLVILLLETDVMWNFVLVIGGAAGSWT